MTALLPRFVDALRNELQQLGEMLALLDAQQEVTTRRAPNFIEPSFAVLAAQSAQLETARARRRLAQEQLAHVLNRPADAPLQDLLACLPSDYRPLVGALVQENAASQRRVREHAERNQQLFRRCAEEMRRFIADLSPENDPTLSTSEAQSIPIQPEPIRDYAAVA